MARTALTRQSLTRAGVQLTMSAVDATAAPNGNSYPSDGSEMLVIKNTDTVAHTCTVAVAAAARPDGLAVTGRTVSVPAGATVHAGPFDATYRQADGNVHLNWDSATGMTVAVVNI